MALRRERYTNWIHHVHKTKEHFVLHKNSNTLGALFLAIFSSLVLIWLPRGLRNTRAQRLFRVDY